MKNLNNKTYYSEELFAEHWSHSFGIGDFRIGDFRKTITNYLEKELSVGSALLTVRRIVYIYTSAYCHLFQVARESKILSFMRATAACFVWKMSPRLETTTHSLWDVACSNLSAENNIVEKFQYNLMQIIKDINIAKPLLPNELAKAIFEPHEEMEAALFLLDPSIDTKITFVTDPQSTLRRLKGRRLKRDYDQTLSDLRQTIEKLLI